MNIAELHRLIRAYLKTVDDAREVERWGTQHAHAEGELDAFAAFVHGRSQAPEAGDDWIACADGMPALGKPVLIFDGSNVCTGWFGSHVEYPGQVHEWKLAPPYRDPTHWRAHIGTPPEETKQR